MADVVFNGAEKGTRAEEMCRRVAWTHIALLDVLLRNKLDGSLGEQIHEITVLTTLTTLSSCQHITTLRNFYNDKLTLRPKVNVRQL